mmetsp:Transcript_9537/g.17293  ORF Transcript_9537/g.17293 Transcript_9537/m.17293 type:complete len:321 (+) Transcript_9537:190-1152(+)|eukprot:CAMPEP_0182491134 /NCGR_PEP_ID=MMETSP1321-20130603/718_1 /TAXON_ID=91990 /ORGANISM="Bolidomonas sp., Strain RCC1657" /LENGTH=320 /DNA_ID=CAMNT_0024693393 /DNA_START=168 /DNA_END=1130 /DNA_ORIENTATION=+
MSLTITPDKQIGFTLSRGDHATKSMLTLANNTGDYFAFKVKTTQPRRYLVRPNQGLVKPGESEEVTIILVDKDKQMLLTDFEQIGPSALESSKDKFLIQSSKVEEEFYNTTKAKGSAKDLAEALTTMWQKISAEKTSVSNTKLQVKHTVDAQSLSSNNNSSSAGYGAVQQSADRIREGMQGTSQNGPGSEGLMPEQQFKNDANLRKKYDELVAFSVNLTAERDILNNALEQAKRDLNREMAARMSAEDSAVRAPSGGGRTKPGATAGQVEEKKAGKKGFTFFQLMLVAVIMFFAGKYVGAGGNVKAVFGGATGGVNPAEL